MGDDDEYKIQNAIASPTATVGDNQMHIVACEQFMHIIGAMLIRATK